MRSVYYKVCFIGGHFTTAQAIIQAFLKGRYSVKKEEIIFFGKKNELGVRSAEYEAITAAGIKFVNLPAVKINRFFSLKNFFSLFLFPFSFTSAFFLLLKYNPRVVVGFGGYLSWPVCLAAKLLGKKGVIHEGTVGAGLTNRFLTQIADKTLISFETSRRFLKNGILTGCPLREEIIGAEKISTKIPTILICGGHLGSKTINECVLPVADKLLEKYIVIHQTGSLDFEKISKFKNSLAPHLKIRYVLADFFNSREYSNYIANAEIVIGRSGINTVCEVLYLGKKAIFIPLPFAQMNEQRENARLVEETGQAVIIEQKDLTPEKLLENIERLKNVAVGSDNKYQKILKEAGEKIAVEITKLL